MTRQTEFLTPGPLHPDLFGGDTPIMVPLDEPAAAHSSGDSLYEVEVCWEIDQTVHCVKVRVPAAHEAAAATTGVRQVRAEYHGAGFEAVDVQRSRTQRQALKRRMRRSNPPSRRGGDQ
ncbi:hypothetical protein B1C78_00640 [Thioalkalivibrio denitrificans]|uniref:Uncharacterized protein n=1 Tax=Thioalkalivibrio denitrificans TaxID=108003 RepID=A0A1V3NV70_9GAMM|nr:hypothetical protein [Thioalkalivibrio denitrificans]OOG28874.1 hypothetical protein B1C78_00640 [Thioalkalivibrio denitrificans]